MSTRPFKGKSNNNKSPQNRKQSSQNRTWIPLLFAFLMVGAFVPTFLNESPDTVESSVSAGTDTEVESSVSAGTDTEVESYGAAESYDLTAPDMESYDGDDTEIYDLTAPDTEPYDIAEPYDNGTESYDTAEPYDNGTESHDSDAAQDDTVTESYDSGAESIDDITANVSPDVPEGSDISVDSSDSTVDSSGVSISEDGVYTSVEDVALYLHTYAHLPGNFITKAQARELGWTGGSLEPYAPGKCIGGDYFGNYEGVLPTGHSYHECDIDTLGARSRGAKRLVYSGDGLIYYTADHYETFDLLYGEP